MPNSTDIKIKLVSFTSASEMNQKQKVEFIAEDYFREILNANNNFGKDILQIASRAAKLLSLRFGKKYQSLLGINPELLANAVWFLYYTELCNIIPTRLVARNSTEELKDKIILIQIRKVKMTSFQLWKSPCDLLPIYQYLELKKLGINAILVLPPHTSPNKLSISLNKSVVETRLLIKDSVAFCPMGIRGAKKAINFAFETTDRTPKKTVRAFLYGTKIKSYNGRKLSKLFKVIFDNEFSRFQVNIPVEKIMENKISKNIMIFKSLETSEYYMREVMSKLITLIECSYSSLEKATIKYNLDEVNLCDHPFLGPSLLAASVRQRSGKIVLWPHSTSQILGMHEYTKPEMVNCIYKNSETVILENLGSKIITRPYLMLSELGTFQRFYPSQKLNVILIAGAHRLNEAPIYPIAQYIDTIQRLILGLSDRKKRVNLLVRPKTTWETFDWYQSLTKQKLRRANVGPSLLNLPNMVFVNFNQASSSIIEGVGRGIPGLIVRESLFNDYFPLDDEYFPKTDVSETLKLIDKFGEKSAIEGFWQKQAQWFKANIDNI